ncbi:MAG: PhoH family protein, partial [bacterium]
MAKRPAVRRTRDQAEQSRQSHSLGGSKHGSYTQEESNVRALFGWNPTAQDDGLDRDQSFLKKVKPRTAGQEKLLDAIDSNPLVVAIGPAGTGKTYLAISKAVEALEAGRVSRIVLSRPAVEAGESIGFLPGHMEEKLAPY